MLTNSEASPQSASNGAPRQFVSMPLPTGIDPQDSMLSLHGDTVGVPSFHEYCKAVEALMDSLSPVCSYSTVGSRSKAHNGNTCLINGHTYRVFDPDADSDSGTSSYSSAFSVLSTDELVQHVVPSPSPYSPCPSASEPSLPAAPPVPQSLNSLPRANASTPRSSAECPFADGPSTADRLQSSIPQSSPTQLAPDVQDSPKHSPSDDPLPLVDVTRAKSLLSEKQFETHGHASSNLVQSLEASKHNDATNTGPHVLEGAVPHRASGKFQMPDLAEFYGDVSSASPSVHTPSPRMLFRRSFMEALSHRASSRRVSSRRASSHRVSTHRASSHQVSSRRASSRILFDAAVQPEPLPEPLPVPLPEPRLSLLSSKEKLVSHPGLTGSSTPLSTPRRSTVQSCLPRRSEGKRCSNLGHGFIVVGRTDTGVLICSGKDDCTYALVFDLQKCAGYDGSSQCTPEGIMEEIYNAFGQEPKQHNVGIQTDPTMFLTPVAERVTSHFEPYAHVASQPSPQIEEELEEGTAVIPGQSQGDICVPGMADVEDEAASTGVSKDCSDEAIRPSIGKVDGSNEVCSGALNSAVTVSRNVTPIASDDTSVGMENNLSRCHEDQTELVAQSVFDGIDPSRVTPNVIGDVNAVHKTEGSFTQNCDDILMPDHSAPPKGLPEATKNPETILEYNRGAESCPSRTCQTDVAHLQFERMIKNPQSASMLEADGSVAPPQMANSLHERSRDEGAVESGNQHETNSADDANGSISPMQHPDVPTAALAETDTQYVVSVARQRNHRSRVAPPVPLSPVFSLMKSGNLEITKAHSAAFSFSPRSPVDPSKPVSGSGPSGEDYLKHVRDKSRSPERPNMKSSSDPACKGQNLLFSPSRGDELAADNVEGVGFPCDSTLLPHTSSAIRGASLTRQADPQPHSSASYHASSSSSHPLYNGSCDKELGLVDARKACDDDCRAGGGNLNENNFSDNVVENNMTYEAQTLPVEDRDGQDPPSRVIEDADIPSDVNNNKSNGPSNIVTGAGGMNIGSTFEAAAADSADEIYLKSDAHSKKIQQKDDLEAPEKYSFDSSVQTRERSQMEFSLISADVETSAGKKMMDRFAKSLAEAFARVGVSSVQLNLTSSPCGNENAPSIHRVLTMGGAEHVINTDLNLSAKVDEGLDEPRSNETECCDLVLKVPGEHLTEGHDTSDLKPGPRQSGAEGFEIGALESKGVGENSSVLRRKQGEERDLNLAAEGTSVPLTLNSIDENDIETSKNLDGLSSRNGEGLNGFIDTSDGNCIIRDALGLTPSPNAFRSLDRLDSAKCVHEMASGNNSSPFWQKIGAPKNASKDCIFAAPVRTDYTINRLHAEVSIPPAGSDLKLTKVAISDPAGVDTRTRTRSDQSPNKVDPNIQRNGTVKDHLYLSLTRSHRILKHSLDTSTNPIILKETTGDNVSGALTQEILDDSAVREDVLAVTSRRAISTSPRRKLRARVSNISNSMPVTSSRDEGRPEKRFKDGCFAERRLVNASRNSRSSLQQNILIHPERTNTQLSSDCCEDQNTFSKPTIELPTTLACAAPRNQISRSHAPQKLSAGSETARYGSSVIDADAMLNFETMPKQKRHSTTGRTRFGNDSRMEADDQHAEVIAEVERLGNDHPPPIDNVVDSVPMTLPNDTPECVRRCVPELIEIPTVDFREQASFKDDTVKCLSLSDVDYGTEINLQGIDNVDLNTEIEVQADSDLRALDMAEAVMRRVTHGDTAPSVRASRIMDTAEVLDDDGECYSKDFEGSDVDEGLEDTDAVNDELDNAVTNELIIVKSTDAVSESAGTCDDFENVTTAGNAPLASNSICASNVGEREASDIEIELRQIIFNENLNIVPRTSSTSYEKGDEFQNEDRGKKKKKMEKAKRGKKRRRTNVGGCIGHKTNLQTRELERKDAPPEEAGPRRSKRQRIRRLKFWKNEQVRYERRLSQPLPTIAQVVIEEDDSDDESWLLGRR